MEGRVGVQGHAGCEQGGPAVAGPEVGVQAAQGGAIGSFQADGSIIPQTVIGKLCENDLTDYQVGAIDAQLLVFTQRQSQSDIGFRHHRGMEIIAPFGR
ncbi:hypothetical protein FVW59_16425 [Parahaliea aestuarii]|uniref:Uncharacterized protein n=1 Tax=Parahaliea aestuarii TaxID=1852021 RepID=A0A5C8ZMA0_9GAMM|nr:hypothetical protein FVW59_16425 [Parahaliea aestuarii]